MQDRAAPSRPALARRGTRPGAAAAGPDARAEALVQRRMQGQADGSAPVRRIAALQGMADAGGGAGVVQAVFAPAHTNRKTHLRQNGVWDTPVPGEIASGAEIVVDPADQQNQVRNRLIGGPATTVWTKAVNVTGANWDHAADAGATTYIRNAKIGATKTYPAATAETAPPNAAPMAPPRLRWEELAGEYVDLGPSVRGAGRHIVKKNGVLRSLTAAHQYDALNNDEQLQTDTATLKTALKTRTKNLLLAAAAGRPWAAMLASDENVETLVIKDANAGGSKALRWDAAIGLVSPEAWINWYTWLPRPFARLQAGATFVVNALDHWRQALYTPNPALVAITKIKLTGSDLHEEGLGAMFVGFTKPAGPPGSKFASKTNFTAVVKSEDKALENALFGKGERSLAHRINRMAGLDPATEAITRFKMETSAQYGSLIEKVRASQLDRGGADRQAATPAMREAMVFAFISGMSDLHYENVLWKKGKPWFIDADNALNNARLALGLAADKNPQGGFKAFNETDYLKDLGNIEKDPSKVDSKIMKLLLETDAAKKEPVVDAIRKTFAGKTGRVVPVPTGSWGAALSLVYITKPDGAPGDNSFNTRWGAAEKYAPRVERGVGFEGPPPGLAGEAGTAAGGGNFNQAEEARQIKADFDRGQIPFYVYAFDTGLVRHNGQVVWHGMPLAAALNILFAKFPEQRGVV